MFRFVFSLLLFILVTVVILLIHRSSLIDAEKIKSLLMIVVLLGLILIVNDLKYHQVVTFSVLNNQTEKNWNSYNLNINFQPYGLPIDDNYKDAIGQQFGGQQPHASREGLKWFSILQENIYQLGIMIHFAQYAYNMASSSQPILSLNMSSEVQNKQQLAALFQVDYLDSVEEAVKSMGLRKNLPILIVFNYHNIKDPRGLLSEYSFKMHQLYNLKVIILGDLTSKLAIDSYKITRSQYRGQMRSQLVNYAINKLQKMLPNQRDYLDESKIKELSSNFTLDYKILQQYVQGIDLYGNINCTLQYQYIKSFYVETIIDIKSSMLIKLDTI